LKYALLGLRFVLAHLLGSTHEILTIGVEVDRPFVAEHVSEGQEFVGSREKLVNDGFSLKLIVDGQ
jgi:hypothetical protein